MLEKYFSEFRKKVIGVDQEFETPYGTKKIIYADWTASGRLYQTIEDKITNEIGPFVGNTHTGNTLTGKRMTDAYHYAKKYIKKHVNAGPGDVIISSNSGMTGVVNKFQRILGLKIHEKYQKHIHFKENERPLVLVTHMEHHSNQTSWIETLADVHIIPSDDKGMVDCDKLLLLLEKYAERKFKIAAVTSFSNVTGVGTPYHEIAKIMHAHQGYCFVDFACSAPYINIDMNPSDEAERLDAIYFSPHKFLGGPGTSGVLVFNSSLYNNKIPDCPGGGTVEWTNPWGDHQYVDDIEVREDGGTPAFLQTIKVALAIRLKEKMGVDNILNREQELFEIIWPKFDKMKNVHVLAPKIKDRLGVFSFYIEGLHFNLAVSLLNDMYGIQTRGGCSCAGTYGHFLLHVDIDTSKVITDKITHGDLSMKPGWVRMSIHPIMTNEELEYIMHAIKYISENFKDLAKEYRCDSSTNEYFHKSRSTAIDPVSLQWINEF